MIGVKLPKDVTAEEVKIASTMSVEIYRKLDDPVDKFIVAMVFDLGYGKEETAGALNISYLTVYKRIKKIRSVLAREFAKRLRD